MTTLSIRKANKEDLNAHIDGAIAAYKLTVQGTNPHTNDRSEGGAIVPMFLETKGNQDTPLIEYSKLIGQGYSPTNLAGLGAKLVQDQYKLFSMTVYLLKPESEQSEDIKALTIKAEQDYNQELDAYSEKMFAQEAAALKAEESAIAAQLKQEDAQKAQAEFDKRVRERMRGAK